MYEHVIAESTATDGTPFRVILEPDIDRTDLDPRKDYSNAGVMYVIDQRDYIVPQEGDVPGIDAAIIDHDFRVVARWLRVVHGATVVLPLYSSYGRDFNVSAGEAGDTPEAGNYIGVTFDTPQTRRDTIGERINPTPESVQQDRATMARTLAADIEMYRQWADGDAWGYRVQTGLVDDEDALDAGWLDTNDSCWGFIGQQWAEEAAEEALDSVVAAYNVEVAKRAADAAALEDEIDDLRRTELGTPA